MILLQNEPFSMIIDVLLAIVQQLNGETYNSESYRKERKISLIYDSITRIESVIGIFSMSLSTLCSNHSIKSSQNLFHINKSLSNGENRSFRSRDIPNYRAALYFDVASGKTVMETAKNKLITCDYYILLLF